jgi:hypothetical protein
MQDRLPDPSILALLPTEWFDGSIIPVARPRTAVAEAVISQAVLETNLSQYTFGVEFEILLPQNMDSYRLAQRLSEAGVQIQVERYNHTVSGNWKIVTDGSLDSTRGREVVSPILQGEDGIEAVRKVCKLLDEVHCTISKKCGFHVHVGARHQPVSFFQNLLRFYARYEDVIDTLVAPSRRANVNNYCRSTKHAMSNEDRAQRIANAQTVLDLAIDYSGYRSTYRTPSSSDVNRFMKVNLHAFWRHGTVEFRQHQGTVSANKAESWVKLCLRMVAAAEQNVIAAGDATLQNMASQLAMPEAELTYFTRRAVELTRVRVSERR